MACLIDGKLKYEKPTDIQQYDYEGKMYNVETNHVSLEVTPNHRMYIRKCHSDNYEIELAENIYNKRRKYKKNVFDGIQQKGLPHFTLPKFKDHDEIILPINDWLIVFGIWIAEGSLGERSLCFATHKDRVKNALMKACTNLGYELKLNHDKPNDNFNKWYIHNVQLANFYKEYNVGSVNKFLPEWVWNLNSEQCRVLIEGMMLGDGHTMANGTRRYDTSSTRLANDFQRLCLHAGYSTNISVKYPAGHYSVIKKEGREGETITSTTDAYRMTIIESQNEPIVNKTIKQDKYVDFKGKVYCCTVPGEGIIYVRKNGKPIWCGNSRH